MITFFPSIYPDELLYSAFARYFDKSGYGIYRAAAEDIYENSLVKPDILFTNMLKPELIDILTKQKSWERIITEHTMYPHYARFLSQERRCRAFKSLLNMDGKHKNALQMPNTGDVDKQFLRYCPLCRQHDREEFGETYWHRQHQLYGVSICPIHRCYLIDSSVSLRGNASPGFFSAETNVIEMKPQLCEHPIEIQLAAYITELFYQDVIDTETSAFRFLHEQMAGGKYTSPRGEQKNVSLLHRDMMNYYRDLQDNPLNELWQLKKVTDGKTALTMGVAMVAMFIGISPYDLANLKMPRELHQEAFDRKIKELHEQGLKYPQIAEIMGVSYDYCKSIGGDRNRKYNRGRTVNNGGVKSRDWEEYDRELLPKVKEAIEAIHSGKEDKPKRVTINAVANYIGITAKRFDNLNLCREEIRKFSENIEEYWAREMVFFYQKLKREGKPITVSAIMNLTNTKKQNLAKGIHCIDQYTDTKTAIDIRELFMQYR